MNFTRGQLKRDNSGGFTLVEIIFSVTLLALAIAVILPTFSFFVKSNYALSDTLTMTTRGRQCMEQLGMDLRSTTRINDASSNSLEIVVEDPDQVEKTIRYVYDTQGQFLTRKVDSEKARTLIDSVTSLKFFYYDSQNNATTNIIDIKRMEIQMTVEASVLDKSQKLEYKSARFSKWVPTIRTLRCDPAPSMHYLDSRRNARNRQQNQQLPSASTTCADRSGNAC